MQIMIKVSDVSNEARPMEVAEPWLDCLLQEFFIQVNFIVYFRFHDMLRIFPRHSRAKIPIAKLNKSRMPPERTRIVEKVISESKVSVLKVRIHRVILHAMLRAMAELHRVSTPKFVARNIAAVESRPTSATLCATNSFVYPPSAAFRAIVSCKFQCSANQISHSNLTADLIFARGTFHVKRWFGLQRRKVH